MEENIKTLVQNLPQNRILSPTNTVAHIFNHDYKENFISDWIAYLLSPDDFGSVETLNAILSLAKNDAYIEKGEKVEIIREKVFPDNRRIDFYIETDNLILGIESKIWSDLEENQLGNYSDALESVSESVGNKEIVKILLFPEQNKGQIIKSSVEDEKRLFGFVPVTFEMLVAAFKRIRVDCITNMRAAFMMQDFITHMEEYIMPHGDGVDNLNYELIMFADKYRDDIREINERVDECRLQFRKHIEDSMIARFSPDDWSYKSTKSCSYFQLYKTTWGDKIHFELQVQGENIFPPDGLKVTLHTRECGMSGKTKELYDLQDDVERYVKEKYKNRRNFFPIEYSSEGTFEKSISQIMDVLCDIVEKYYRTIDSEIIKAQE